MSNQYILDRVKYYLGNIKDHKWELSFCEDEQVIYYLDYNKCLKKYKQFSDFIRINLIDKNFSVEIYKKKEYDRNLHSEMVINYEINGYIEPIINLFNSDEYFKEKRFLFRPDDVYFHIDIPIITKTRPLGDSYNVLLDLDSNRHWSEVKTVDKYDISFVEKNDKIIWRGASNGFGWLSEEILFNGRPTRKSLCKKYWNISNKMIDIGIINNQWENKEYNKYIKPRLSIEEQLKSKFLISLEGADVATNLKWMLYSNSVVIMPHPTMVSWAMEDTLQPWVHYVPLEKDFDDLEEKYNWCINNLDKCEQIAKNGKEFIKQFLDEEREKQIINMVLRGYVDHVNICVKNLNID